MIISVDAGKTFDKSQCPLMTETLAIHTGGTTGREDVEQTHFCYVTST